MDMYPNMYQRAPVEIIQFMLTYLHLILANQLRLDCFGPYRPLILKSVYQPGGFLNHNHVLNKDQRKIKTCLESTSNIFKCLHAASCRAGVNSGDPACQQR